MIVCNYLIKKLTNNLFFYFSKIFFDFLFTDYSVNKISKSFNLIQGSSCFKTNEKNQIEI